jgi:hypothetical protein
MRHRDLIHEITSNQAAFLGSVFSIPGRESYRVAIKVSSVQKHLVWVAAV